MTTTTDSDPVAREPVTLPARPRSDDESEVWAPALKRAGGRGACAGSRATSGSALPVIDEWVADDEDGEG
jgi:hypothetical protein